MSYINKFKVLAEKHYSCRKGISTNDAIAALKIVIYKNIEQKRPQICVFLDLAKASDTVDHALLLQTLASIGIHFSYLKAILVAGKRW